MAESARIPPALARSAVERRGEEGEAWLRRLPEVVGACAARWSLRVAAPLPNLSYNYVAPAVRRDRSRAMLKLSFPDDAEFSTEVAALQLFDGRGAVRLLEVDLALGAMLLERLMPGTSLDAVDDDAATIIAAGVMRRLWRPVPAGHRFPTLAAWVRGMADRAPGVLAARPGFPARWIDHAVALHRELAGSSPEPVVLHGDLHQGNLLAAERDPWLAIDPKGVVGETSGETAPFLLNHLPPGRDPDAIRKLLGRRLAGFSDALGLDRARLRAWTIVRAVLMAYWTLEDHGHGWEPAIACAALLEENRL